MIRYYVDPLVLDWGVKRESQLLSIHDTKQQAIETAKPLAKRERGQLIVRRRDGTWEEEFTYGDDPYPPRG